MALRSLPRVLLLLRLYKDIIVSATTIVHFYTDASCKVPYATVQTDTDTENGQCGEFTTVINSASSSAIDYGCSVTTYTGSYNAFCSYDATLVPIGGCTAMIIGSFSVDCPQINGSYNPDYTTSLASDVGSQTSLPSTTSTSTPSVPVSPSPSSQQSTSTSFVPVSPISPSQQTSPTGKPSPNPSSFTTSTTGIPSPTPSSTTSSLPETLISPLHDIRSSSPATSQPSSLPSSSPSSSPGQKGSGNDGGLSGPSTIAIGVVLPGVAVIVAVIFGVLGVQRWRKAP